MADLDGPSRAASIASRAMGAMVASNNRRIRRVVGDGHPVSVPDDQPWHRTLSEALPVIRSEWDRFASSGGRLPLIEEVLGEHQGNEGHWRAGLLVASGRPCGALARQFPGTTAALRQVPLLRAALLSVLEPGTELPEHVGPNAGVLRYHLGIRCVGDTALRVGDVIMPYREGQGILFDDTRPHAAWNRGPEDRITLFCELRRPLPPLASMRNAATQRFISLDPRYRRAPRRAAALHAILNP